MIKKLALNLEEYHFLLLTLLMLFCAVHSPRWLSRSSLNLLAIATSRSVVAEQAALEIHADDNAQAHGWGTSKDVASSKLRLAGIAEYAQGDYHEALQLFKSAGETDNRQSLARLWAGITYLEVKRPQEAAIEFHYGGLTSTQVFIRGNKLLEANDLARASLWYSAAEAMGLRSVQLYVATGVANENLGKVSQALRDYERAIEIGLERGNYGDRRYRAEAYYRAGILLPWEQLPCKIRYFHEAIELNPELWTAYLALGDTLYRRDGIDAAAIYYQTAIRLAPQRAVSWFEVSAVEYPNDPDRLYWMARAYDEAGEPNKAAEIRFKADQLVGSQNSTLDPDHR